MKVMETVLLLAVLVVVDRCFARAVETNGSMTAEDVVLTALKVGGACFERLDNLLVECKACCATSLAFVLRSVHGDLLIPLLTMDQLR